jgi:PPOX class probable F420-dependent enzyme
MTDIPATHQDLLQSSVGTLATLGPDGRPQQTEIWFIYDDSEIKLSLNTTRQKVKNLRARSQCSLLIVDPADSQRYLEVRGDAIIAPDEGGALVEKVNKKYGVDVRGYDGPDDERIVVRLVPSKINAVDMRG